MDNYSVAFPHRLYKSECFFCEWAFPSDLPSVDIECRKKCDAYYINWNIGVPKCPLSCPWGGPFWCLWLLWETFGLFLGLKASFQDPELVKTCESSFLESIDTDIFLIGSNLALLGSLTNMNIGFIKIIYHNC